jgi:hypothetical protein
MRVLLIIYIVLGYGMNYSFSQNKKEQIEYLNFRIDSLNKEIQNQKILNIQLNVSSAIILLKMDSLENLNKSLNQENKSLTLNVDSLSNVNDNYTTLIDSLTHLIIKDNNPFERQTEIYENCIPRDVYNKENCSELELEYDIVQSELLGEDNEVLVKKLIQLLLFNQDINSQILDYSKIKIEAIKDFINNTDEYYIQAQRSVYCGFVNPKLICLDYYSSEYNEGAPRPENGSQHLIYNLAKKKVTKYYDIFLPNSKNQLMLILVNHINQLLTIDEFKNEFPFVNFIPESNNIDDFRFDFENFLISTQCEKIVSGKLTKEDGFGFYFGDLFTGNQVAIINLPFSQCAHLLTPEFFALIK